MINAASIDERRVYVNESISDFLFVHQTMITINSIYNFFLFSSFISGKSATLSGADPICVCIMTIIDSQSDEHQESGTLMR